MNRNRYLEEFVSLRCAADLLALKLYPNAKEITEALGLFHAVAPFRQLKKCLGHRTALVVGDGVTPRLGAMLAFRMPWTVVSVDPEMRRTDWDIHGLTCVKSKVESISPVDCAGGPAVLFLPHSHAPTDVCVTKLVNYSRLTIVNMPCCVPVPEVWNRIPHRVYRDLDVISNGADRINKWELLTAADVAAVR